MEPTVRKTALALCVAAALAGCHPGQERTIVKKPAGAQAVFAAEQSASTGSSQPAQAAPVQPAPVQQAPRAATALPDFTGLMKSAGPTVVNVISTSKASRSR